MVQPSHIVRSGIGLIKNSWIQRTCEQTYDHVRIITSEHHTRRRWSHNRNQRNLSDFYGTWNCCAWIYQSMSDLMGGFTQHCNCDNAFFPFRFGNKLTAKLIVVNEESENVLRNVVSINLYFLNSTFICIYNISRFVCVAGLSWVKHSLTWLKSTSSLENDMLASNFYIFEFSSCRPRPRVCASGFLLDEMT